MHRILGFLIVTVLLLGGCNKTAATPSSIIRHPDRHNATVEYFAELPVGRGPWPTIVFLHGQQGPMERIGGKVFVNWNMLRRFANKGYLAVSVSLPGYGKSTGPEDFAGPFTQNAVKAVLTDLITERQAKPGKIVLQGVSLGAVTAALVASQNQDVQGLVLISGLYDLPAFFARPKTSNAMAIKAALIQQTGGSEKALQSRSALAEAANIHAATLILNGAKDDRTDPAQAQQFAAAINASGGNATVHIFPDFGHEIPMSVRDAEVTKFIAATLAK